MTIDDIDVLRIKHGIGKVCCCVGYPSYTVDPDCRKVYCNGCGAEVDAFSAICRLAYKSERFHEQLKWRADEIAKAEKRRLRSTLFRDMQHSYHADKVVPCCPVCEEPFEFEKIVRWVGRKVYELTIHAVQGDGTPEDDKEE